MSIDYAQLRELMGEATPGPWERNPESPRVLCNLGRKFAVHVELTRNGEEPQPEDVANTELIALAPDMARELLILRDGVATVRDRCATLAESAQEAGMHALANEMDTNAQTLTALLQEGDK